MSAAVVRLEALERDARQAYLPFTCDASLDPLLWESRTLSLYCSEGVASDPAQLAAAFCLGMAPLAWTRGARLELTFPILQRVARSLDSLGAMLAEHYGWTPIGVTAGMRVVRDTRPVGLHRGLMFSGGIDSAAALIELGDRVDWLIHLSNFENLESQMTGRQLADELATTRAVADARGLGWIHLRTNLPAIFKHNRFDGHFPPDCSFWLGLEHVQHIATALAAMRPRLERVYLAGGFGELLRRVGSCAASATFVNRYAVPMPLSLVDEHTSRQRKVERIIDRGPDLLRSLRVCYSSGGQPTCADCLKCQATTLMVLSGGGSLEDTPFPPEILDRLVHRIDELSKVGPEGHAFFNETLTGRLLRGSRERRWRDLRAIVVEQQNRRATQPPFPHRQAGPGVVT